MTITPIRPACQPARRSAKEFGHTPEKSKCVAPGEAKFFDPAGTVLV